MLRKLLVLGAASGALCLLPAMASAQPQAGDWELTLVGSGTANKDLNQASIGATAGVGYFFTKNAEVQVRQGIGYTDYNFGTQWSGSTYGAFDWHFDLDRWQPFIGANIGAGYGTGKPDWNAGLEGGVKYYVHRHAFVFGQAAYEFSLEDSDNSGFIFSLGIGTNW